MTKLTLQTIGSDFGSKQKLNNNFQAIVDAFEKNLSRDGTSPNAMLDTLDMNSNRIINLPDGILDSEPVTVGQLETSLGTIVDVVEEAPLDSILYGRENAAWVQVPTQVISSDAASDNSYYARRNAGWISFTPFTEAPVNGTQYVRKDAGWTAITSTGISDAPADGTTYGRNNNAWAVVSGGGGLSDAASDGTLYGRKNAAWIAVPAAAISSDAASDNAYYARRNAAWTSTVPWLTDAASDGTNYGRKNGAWFAISTTGGTEFTNAKSVIDYGWSAADSGTNNATAAYNAIVAAMAADTAVIFPAGSYYSAALPALPTSGTLRLVFSPGCIIKAPGASASASWDISLFQPKTDTFIYGNHVQFYHFRRVFNFDAIGANKVVYSEKLRFWHTGRCYNYTGSASRSDYSPSFGIQSTSANATKSLVCKDFVFEGTTVTDICDFGIIWRSPVAHTYLNDIRCEAIQRVSVLIGDTSLKTNDVTNVSIDKVNFNQIHPVPSSSGGTMPTTENQQYGILVYGFNVMVNDATIQNVYDLHTVHNSNALFYKAAFSTTTNVFIRNGGRETRGFVNKAALASGTYSDLKNVENWAFAAGTAWGPYHYVDNMTIILDPTFASTYTAESNTAMYLDSQRWKVGKVNIIGNYTDRGMEIHSSCELDGPISLMGDMGYGILVSIGANSTSLTDDDHVHFGDIQFDGNFVSNVLEVRSAYTTGTHTIREVIFDRVRGVLRAGSTGLTGIMNVVLYKGSATNKYGTIKVNPGCHIESERGSTANMAGLCIDLTNFGTGTAGTVDRVIVNGLTVVGTDCAVNIAGGGCQWGYFDDVYATNISGTNVMKNMTQFPGGQVFIRNLRGYPSEIGSRDLIVASGGTTGTLTLSTMGYDTSKNSNILPQDISDFVITPPKLTGTRTWGASFSGSTLTITISSSDSVDQTFGVRTYNRHYQ